MKTSRILLIAGFLILFSAAVVYAVVDPLSPTDPPGSTSSYTLEDIYQRLDVGTAGSQSAWTEPSAGPGASMHTLNEIMDKVPVVDDTGGATAAQVLSGQTYWSLLSPPSWGSATGSMPNIGQQNFTPGTSEQTISAGYHDGTGSVAGDADLAAENIKCGVTIFGVTGSLTDGSTVCVETESVCPQDLSPVAWWYETSPFKNVSKIHMTAAFVNKDPFNRNIMFDEDTFQLWSVPSALVPPVMVNWKPSGVVVLGDTFFYNLTIDVSSLPATETILAFRVKNVTSGTIQPTWAPLHESVSFACE